MGGRSAAANPCSDLPGFCPAVSPRPSPAAKCVSRTSIAEATGTLDALHAQM